MKVILVFLAVALPLCAYSQDKNHSRDTYADKALLRFFEKELRYPEKAVLDTLSGVLFLKMRFDQTKGRITSVHTSDASKSDFSHEVLRVATLLRRRQSFHKYAGKTVIIPFEFLHGDTNQEMQINRDQLFSETSFFNTEAIILKPIIIVSRRLTRTY